MVNFREIHRKIVCQLCHLVSYKEKDHKRLNDTGVAILVADS